MPDENSGENLGELCIARSNLKYLDDRIGHANLKKNRLPKYFTWIAATHNSAQVWIALINLRSRKETQLADYYS